MSQAQQKQTKQNKTKKTKIEMNDLEKVTIGGKNLKEENKEIKN